jgi:signal transduction histidine kinase
VGFPLDLTQVVELILVGAGALGYLHLVLARSTSARTLWFNGQLFGWALCWSIWFASVFSALNLETISYGRFPMVSMVLDLVKGSVLNIQSGFLLHGLVRWTGAGKRIPWPVWYLLPLATLVRGGIQVATHPMETFLANVEPVVRVYLATDIVTNLVAIVLLTLGLARMDPSQASVARPLRKAFLVMAPLSAVAFALKIYWGYAGPGRYQWVILHDLTHLVAPAALIWACYRTESVALSVTRSGWRRAGWLAGAFLLYMFGKFLWPLSELDHLGAWAMASLGFVGTMGPLSITAGRSLFQWLNWELTNESHKLSDLESELWASGLSEENLPPHFAKTLSAILECRAVVLPATDPRVARILEIRSCAWGEAAPIAMMDATSRSEIPAWQELGARTLLPVHGPDSSWVVALGASALADPMPRQILTKLGSMQGTCERVLRSRKQLREAVQTQRRLQETERLAMLGLLSASAAHEIKNPLSAIRNVASAAMRDAPADSVLHRDLTVVVGEVDRLDATVRRMLLFARDRETCKDAPETVNVVAGLLSAEARHRGLRLQVVTDRACAVPMSENDFKAILFNLIQNAMAHAPKGSSVLVRLDPEGPALEVENEGEIAAEILPRLFRPLASQSGTGLGLYISRTKAEDAKARLEHRPVPGKTIFRLAWETP